MNNIYKLAEVSKRIDRWAWIATVAVWKWGWKVFVGAWRVFVTAILPGLFEVLKWTGRVALWFFFWPLGLWRSIVHGNKKRDARNIRNLALAINSTQPAYSPAPSRAAHDNAVSQMIGSLRAENRPEGFTWAWWSDNDGYGFDVFYTNGQDVRCISMYEQNMDAVFRTLYFWGKNNGIEWRVVDEAINGKAS